MPHIAEKVLQAAGIGGWEIELATGRLTWTAITFQIHELDPSQAPSLAEALAYYPPEVLPRVHAAVQSAIDTGSPWDIETPLVTARGRHRWVHSWGQAVREHGRTVRLVGALQDVTDYRELHAKTERLSVIAAQMTNIVITIDRHGRITWVNDALTRLFGHTLQEALGRNPADLLQGPRTDPATIRQMAQGLEAGTGFEVEIENYTKAGMPCWTAVTCSPLREADGTVSGFIALHTDINARRAAEQAARAQAAAREKADLLLRDVLETLPIGVTVFDSGNRFVLANRAYREMFPIAAGFLAEGRTLEALMRLGAEHGQYVGVPADEAGREAWFAQRMANFRAPTGIARTLELPDGRCMQVRERRSDNGTLVIVRADTTELHAAEATARRGAGERGRAEALLQDVLDALPNAITAYDSQDRLVMSNRRFAEMFPIAARFAVAGCMHGEIIRLAAESGQYADAPAEPAALSAWLAELLGHFRDGTTHELRLPDGRIAELRESRSQSGNRVTVRTDITGLRLAEARARTEAAERARTEILLRDVLDAVPSAIVAYDQDERIIVSNPADAERLSLPGPSAAIGDRLEDVIRRAVRQGHFRDAPVVPAEQEAFIQHILASLRDPATPPRTVHLADGRAVLVSTRRSGSGNLIVIRTDITDLLRVQALLHDVLEAMPSAVVAYDPEEHIILANQALGERAPMLVGAIGASMRLPNVLRLAAEGGYFADLPAAPADQDGWLAELLAFFRSDAGVPRTLRVSEGRSVQLRARRSASGNLVVTSTDITELVGAQALLRDVMDALPNAVIAYDRGENVILYNRAHMDMAPSARSFVVSGGTLERAVRQATELGYFADAPSAPAAREAWLGLYLAFLRDSGGLPRTTHLASGRAVQVRTLRSQTGNLVIVRTDITDLLAAQALLRDVMDALPNAVVAFDRDERIVLTNRANATLWPPGVSFAGGGDRLEDAARLAATHGYFADAPSAPAAREAWLASYLSYLRESGGIPRTMRLSDGRVVQVRTLRSETGNLVIVRNDVTELLGAQAMLRDVLDAIPNSVAAYDPEDRLILFNPAYEQMIPVSTRMVAAGQRYEDIVRHSVALGTYPAAGATPEAREAWIAEQVAHHRAPGAARVLRMADGRIMLGLERRSDSGTLVSVRTDITAQTQTEALLRDILEALPSAVIAYDRDERLVLWNRAAADMLPEAATFATAGRKLEEMIRLSVVSGAYLDVDAAEAGLDQRIAAILAAYRASSGSRTQRMRDGRFLTALERRSESGNLVCVRTDTTDLKRAEQTLRWQAERDPLTKLHNRNFFLTALDQALDAARGIVGNHVEGVAGGAGGGGGQGDGGEKDAGGVLLLLDIDYFKQVNDTLGHDMGDALLVEIATRLRLHLRDGGEGAARLGGDEFGLVIPGLTDPASMVARIDALHAALLVPADLGGRPTPVGISMGTTVFPADGTDATKLLKNADMALYEAKRRGRGRWTPFQPEQATTLERHVRMADALREALSRHLFTVALQPKRRLRDGAHAGFEALARWHDGTNWVPPGEFIAVAEDTGLIRPLGRAVMEAALARIREMRDRGLEPGRVAFNVTGPQLLDPHFTEQTLAALRRHGLGPADLELELTGATLFGRASEPIDRVLREVSGLGITLALDNFGTGDASLAHLSRLPIDRLKIDRSFVVGIGRAGRGSVIARTVINLARSLGMESIAKGVETAEQRAFLAKAGCDVAQGYLVSRPLLTTAEAIAYLGVAQELMDGRRAV